MHILYLVATCNDAIVTHYVVLSCVHQGKLENGEEFDNSFTRGEPIEFQLGAQQVRAGDS